MKKFGLIGFPLNIHFQKNILKKIYENEKLEYVNYDNYEIR